MKLCQKFYFSAVYAFPLTAVYAHHHSAVCVCYYTAVCDIQGLAFHCGLLHLKEIKFCQNLYFTVNCVLYSTAVYDTEVCNIFTMVCNIEVHDIFIAVCDTKDRVKLLIQGSELSLQERESKLYDDFGIFTSMLSETIHLYYMRFAQLINDMHTMGMIMKPLQVNTKFVNHLQPEWSKFVTDVNLAKDMHTTNFDHMYAHLRQQEAHENEVHLSRQRYPNQIALVANSLTCLNLTQYHPQLSSATQQYYLPLAPQRYMGQLKHISEMCIDKMHQPWRIFRAIINRCLSGKTLSNDRLQPSRIGILWDKSEGEPHNRPNGRNKLTPRDVYIQEPLSVPIKKPQESSSKLKGIELLYEAAQFEMDTQKAVKASKHEIRFQYQVGGSSEGAGLRSEVPDELTGKSAVSDKGADTQSEVLDETKDESKAKDDQDDWGSTQEEELLRAYKDEKPKEIPWTDTDVEDHVKGVAEMNIVEEVEEENTERLEEQKDDEKLKAGEEQKGDDQVDVPHIEQEPFHVVKVSVIPKTIQQPPLTSPAPPLLATEIPSTQVSNSKARDYKDAIEESVQANFVNEVKNILLNFLPKTVKEALEKTLHSLGQSSSQEKRPRSDQDEDPSVGSNEGKKTKNRKFNESESSKKTFTTKEASRGKSPAKTSKSCKSVTAVDPIEDLVFEKASGDVERTFDDKVDDASKPPHMTTDETQVDTNPKISKKDWFKDSPKPELLDPDWNTVQTIDDSSEQPWFNKMVQAEKPPLTFDELMSTPIDFLAFSMNRLKLNNITRADLVGPIFNLLKGTCKSCVELEYNMEECYRALTDQLDWTNREGHLHSVDMRKPLPLQDKKGRLVIPVELFFNNDLEYLRAGSSERKYSFSIIKTPAARAMINMVSKHKFFSTMRILSVVSVQVEKRYGYGYLKEIIVRRANQKLYKFKEGDFPELHLNDIEDMLLLIAQNNLFNLDGDVIMDFVTALKMFSRGIILKNRVEDVHLDIESYQRKLNLTKP
nr:integrase, catalytic region, zinc finger, CCHC-type, peptidase aspartic, catalytic [Tanacetum cinerariifolium]